MPDGPVTTAPLVRVAGVTKRFTSRRSSVVALEAIDLDVQRGEFVSLIGPSGCGKSTLLRIIGGLADPDEGVVAVDGASTEQARRQKQFGWAPQTPALLAWRSVLDNARLLTEVNRGAEAHGVLSEHQTLDLLREVGLGDVVRAYPRELSGGMQQRVSLVRLFSLGAPILLMDEPFAALDEITRADMRYLLLRLRGDAGATVLFVTHSIPEAVILSDRVAVMAGGPGRITHVEPITVPRPRRPDQEDTPEFLTHVAAIRRALADGDGRSSS